MRVGVCVLMLKVCDDEVNDAIIDLDDSVILAAVGFVVEGLNVYCRSCSYRYCLL